jgi:hypothetical protein
MPVVRMSRAITALPASTVRPEETMVGRAMTGMLGQAHVVSCPPEQLNAVADDIFADLGEAFDYAAAARLPFEVTFFDFLDEHGEGPAITAHIIDGGGEEMGFDLKAVVVSEDPRERQTTYMPVIGMKGQPPEEIGAAFVDWDRERGTFAEPARWSERMPGLGGSITLFSVSTAMEALEERPRPIAGALMGVARGNLSDEDATYFKSFAATMTATAVRQTLKLLYLLDSANVELAPAPVSRQVRRQAERQGTQIAGTVQVRQASRSETTEQTDGSREYSHRFEVRGNFAHYAAGTWLYEHSVPEDIRPCPRCGQCRRVWRPAHIKGPRDRPLAIKFRRVTFRDDASGDGPSAQVDSPT